MLIIFLSNLFVYSACSVVKMCSTVKKHLQWSQVGVVLY